MSSTQKTDMSGWTRVSIKNYSDRRLALLLFCVSALFYLLQTSHISSNADAIVYSLRSLSQFPVFDYAFLDESDPGFRLVLPNYHLGHTVLLWIVFQIVPDSLGQSAWLSSAVSSLSGGLSVALSFLIWRSLSIPTTAAFWTAVAIAVIPSIAYQSTIGELYAVQLTSILLFFYLFLQQRFLLSALAFLGAVLISPLSGLSFALLLLAAWNRKNIVRALMLGFGCLAIYLSIFHLLDTNIFATFDALQNNIHQRSISSNAVKLALVLAVNLNFLVICFLIGWRSGWRQYPRIFTMLILAALPQVALITVSTEFLREMGCFLLVLLWLFGLPIGIGLSTLSRRTWHALLPLAGCVVVMLVFWNLPDRRVTDARQQAGAWLKHNVADEIKLLGDWNNGVAISVARHGWSEDSLTDNFLETHRADNWDLYKTRQSSIVLTVRKQSKARLWLATLPPPLFKLKPYDVRNEINLGTLRKLYENDAIILYQWGKPT